MYFRELEIVILFGLIPFAYCAKWIIMLENSADIEKEYFYVRNNPETDSSNDKFRGKTTAELGEVCDRLKNSKIYNRLYLPYPSPIPQPMKVHEIPERSEDDRDRLHQDLSYAYRRLKKAAPEITEEERVPVFPCQTHESTSFWLTYGFSDDILFLLKEVDGDQAVSFVGQSTPVPDIDRTFTQGKPLDDYYFQKATPKFERSVPKVLYPFVSSVQFRLCCLAHAARKDGHKGPNSFTINYANSDPNAESNRYYYIQSHGPSTWQEIYVWVLGCLINPTVGDDYEFYLRHNAIDPFAVFALDPVCIRTGYKKLHVNQLLINVKVPVASAFHKLGMESSLKRELPIIY